MDLAVTVSMWFSSPIDWSTESSWVIVRGHRCATNTETLAVIDHTTLSWVRTRTINGTVFGTVLITWPGKQSA